MCKKPHAINAAEKGDIFFNEQQHLVKFISSNSNVKVQHNSKILRFVVLQLAQVSQLRQE